MALTPAFERQLERIARDPVHGASWLAQRGVEALVKLCQALPAQGEAASLQTVQAAVERVAAARPAMASLANWAYAFWHQLRAALSDAPAGITLQQAALKVGQRLQQERKQLIQRQVEAAVQVLKPYGSLMTLSYSSTVERILLQAAPHAQVLVLESRPLLEGRTLALALHRQGRAVRLITEAQMLLALQDADAVLLGADAVCADLAVVNKVGSHALCWLAKQQGLSVFVAADLYKCNPTVTAATLPLEAQPADQVWPDHPELCQNVVFEATPPHLIDRFISERGALNPSQMRQAMRQVQAGLRG